MEFFSPQGPLVKYSIPECKDTCELDEFVKLVKSLQVRDVTSWCRACGNTQLSRCQVTQQQTVCPTLETKEPRLSGTGGFFPRLFCHAAHSDMCHSLVAFLSAQALFTWRNLPAPKERPF